MALKVNNFYIKIIFDECKVQGNSVYITVQHYISIEEREKEKNLQHNLDTFRYNLSLLNTSDQAGAFREQHPGLVETILRYGYMISDIYLYKNPDVPEIPLESIPSDIMYYLNKCGLDDKWITNPIQLNGKEMIYVGEYNNEIINHTFYYNRAKRAFPDAIDLL